MNTGGGLVWSLPEMKRPEGEGGVVALVSDMCVFGVVSKGRRGQNKLIRKPTRWLSNAPAVLREVGVLSTGAHAAHVELLGGRAAAAARYALRRCEAILWGGQAQQDGRAHHRRPSTT